MANLSGQIADLENILFNTLRSVALNISRGDATTAAERATLVVRLTRKLAAAEAEQARRDDLADRNTRRAEMRRDGFL